MRIIGGSHKGRNIIAPGNLPVRPTTDFAKEGLFNMLANKIDFEGMEILDLFAGTGNITYEFASRGAKNVLAVDINFHCTTFIRSTAEKLKLENIRVIKSDVFRFVNTCNQSFDLIFSDAPYDLEKVKELPDKIFEKKLLKAEGLLIVEHSEEHNFATHPHFSEHRNYGKVNFSFFKN